MRREAALAGPRRTILVIGGGASGVLAAVQLLRQPGSCRVVLFERNADLAAGVAYGTEHPGHLLNVAASGMSAFPDQPAHFQTWLAGRDEWRPAEGWSPRSFAPRRLYRDYLAALLDPWRSDGQRFSAIRSEIVDLRETPDGVAAMTQDGVLHEADAAILATGNEGPQLAPATWRHDCWSSRSGFAIPPDQPVAIIGTGLSMVDSVISLLDAGHSGPITAVSRRGILPEPHAPSQPCRIDESGIPFGAGLPRLMQWVRRRAAETCAGGEDWRGVVDGLRPHTQALWRSLAAADRRRFLSHARPWWDSHRHRMAPQIRARIDATRAAGQLSVVSGRIRGVEPTADGARLRMVPRGSTTERVLSVGSVIECRGHSTDVAATRNAVLRRLLERGLVRADALRLGLDVSADCAVIAADGRPSRSIYAVGPITVGTFWEIVAIPDIRMQAAALAGRLAAPR